MSKHTPGSWKVSGGRVYVTLPDGKEQTIHRAPGSERCLFAEEFTNARLIAAAPDLLAACELTLAHLTSAAHRETKIIPPVLAALRASIAKATGGDL